MADKKDKICDICGAVIGRKRFRCSDGVLCKDCYQIVTNNFSDTIADKTLQDLKMTYVQNVYRAGLMRERQMKAVEK